MRVSRVGSGAVAPWDQSDGRVRRRWRRGLGVSAAVIAGSIVLAACGGSSSNSGGTKGVSSTHGLYGALPASAGSPTSGGTLTFAQLQGSTPTYIMPIVPAADESVYVVDFFQDEMYEPLFSSPVSSTPSIDFGLSIADKPVFSNGDKTVTINMKKGYTWSNGAPVDANDVVFNIDLIKAAVKESAANFGAYTPGLFPDNVSSVTATSKYQVTLTVTKKSPQCRARTGTSRPPAERTSTTRFRPTPKRSTTTSTAKRARSPSGRTPRSGRT
jgi:peptide/nickel transport system substrate-binding protein